MPLKTLILRTAILLLGCACAVRFADAEVTPEQLQELRELKQDLAKLSGLLREKDYDAADALLDDAEARVKSIMADAAVPASSRRLLGLPQLIASRRRTLDRQRQKGGDGVSFQEDVAPVIAEQCLDCHGPDDPRAGLNLSTFAGWKGGGKSGPLLIPGAALKSRLILRLGTADAKVRMPQGKDPLPRETLATIAAWINQGARFDGEDESTPLARPRPDVDIPRPKGTETVSFTKDIAPFLVRLCVRCHSGAMPRGGLSLVTFADMLVGGDSGVVILPGNREESRLFRLVGGLENPRMPQGDARITRKNYEDLITWFDEGNVFDGEDPYAPLTSYVPTDEELAAEKLEAMSAEEWLAHRRARTEEIWKQSLPNNAYATVEADQFLLAGNVPPERLQQIGEWADEHLGVLQRTFSTDQADGGQPLWRGKLAVIVFRERFGFAEYSRSVRDRRDFEGVYGDAVVTPTGAEAYVVIQDIGDTPSETQPGLHAALREKLTEAFLRRGVELPEVLARGAGLSVAYQLDRSNPYYKQLPQQAAEVLFAIEESDDLFASGAFSPASSGAVGFTMMQFLIQRTSNARFAELFAALRQGRSLDEAFRSTTRTDAAAFARAFLRAAKASR